MSFCYTYSIFYIDDESVVDRRAPQKARGRQPETRNKQPETSNQQPGTSNQQPTPRERPHTPQRIFSRYIDYRSTFDI